MGRFTSSNIKPALKGEVDASVTSRRRVTKQLTALCLSQPLSQSALRRIASSPSGAPFGAPYKLIRSHAIGRISHGAAIFHIAKAIFDCASAQFHRMRKHALPFLPPGFLYLRFYFLCLRAAQCAPQRYRNKYHRAANHGERVGHFARAEPYPYGV